LLHFFLKCFISDLGVYGVSVPPSYAGATCDEKNILDIILHYRILFNECGRWGWVRTNRWLDGALLY